MTYQCINQLQQKAVGVAPLCRLLGVSRSGYYAARQRAQRPAKLCGITPYLQAAFAESSQSYGSRRLRIALDNRGIAVSRYRVRALMKNNGLRPVCAYSRPNWTASPRQTGH